MSRLLKKVTDLEEKVTTDTGPGQNKGKRMSVLNRLTATAAR